MFHLITEFENKVAEFFGSPYAVAIDSCTHALELCLRYNEVKVSSCPNHTYLSVPLTFKKLGITWTWDHENWQESYQLGNTNIIDGATMWRNNSYIAGTFTCISFQFQKHLSLGRGGMILTDNKQAYQDLIKMSYDGRIRGVSWAQQEINSMGYHYYMTPETAELGLKKLKHAIKTSLTPWDYTNYPDLTKILKI